MTIRTLHAGFDPGASGALVVLDDYGDIVFAGRLKQVKLGAEHRQSSAPDVLHLAETFRSLGNADIHATVEEAMARGKQSITAMFNYGRGFGCLIAVATLFCSSSKFVLPTEWQPRMLAPKESPNEDSKIRANRAAIRLWPELATMLKVKANQGIADAALIAEYGRRQRKLMERCHS